MTNHNDTLYYKSGERQGNNPEEGDEVEDFRGDIWVFIRVTRPREPGRSAKVEVTDLERTPGHIREFYSTVFPIFEAVL